MSDHRVLVPLGQQNVQAQPVFGCQWFRSACCNLACQCATDAVGLLRNILLQLHLAQPEDQNQHEQQRGNHHQRHRPGQSQRATA